VQVVKNSKVITNMGRGKVFGELAILYNCTRTASVKALTHCKLWALDRNTYQSMMVRYGIKKQTDTMDLIKKYIALYLKKIIS
jgi:cGMP-dependent protein kinase 1